MIFTGDDEERVQGGDYVYQAVVGAGAVTLTFSIDGQPFVAVPGGAFAVDDSAVIALPTCKLKAGLTSDATFVMGVSRRQ